MVKLPLCQRNGLSNKGTIVQLSGPRCDTDQQYILTMLLKTRPKTGKPGHVEGNKSLGAEETDGDDLDFEETPKTRCFWKAS